MKTTKVFWIVLSVYFLIMCIVLGLQSCNQRDPKDLVVSDDSEGYMSERDIENLQRDLDTSETFVTKGELKGMRLFMQHCNRCHPAGEKGKGPALIDKKLPDFLIHFQIRNGLGDMPAFKEKDIAKEDVKKIILFVRWLRDNTPAR
jgi:mono/diheme cytochrome c family protein